MNSRAKRLQRMRDQPNGQWHISDIIAVCGDYCMTCLPARGGGSHYKVTCLGSIEILTIPAHRPIKAVYIKKLIALIERYGSEPR